MMAALPCSNPNMDVDEDVVEDAGAAAGAVGAVGDPKKRFEVKKVRPWRWQHVRPLQQRRVRTVHARERRRTPPRAPPAGNGSADTARARACTSPRTAYRSPTLRA